MKVPAAAGSGSPLQAVKSTSQISYFMIAAKIPDNEKEGDGPLGCRRPPRERIQEPDAGQRRGGGPSSPSPRLPRAIAVSLRPSPSIITSTVSVVRRCDSRGASPPQAGEAETPLGASFLREGRAAD